jgi:hypothetical protein
MFGPPVPSIWKPGKTKYSKTCIKQNYTRLFFFSICSQVLFRAGTWSLNEVTHDQSPHELYVQKRHYFNHNVYITIRINFNYFVQCDFKMYLYICVPLHVSVSK